MQEKFLRVLEYETPLAGEGKLLGLVMDTLKKEPFKPKLAEVRTVTDKGVFKVLILIPHDPADPDPPWPPTFNEFKPQDHVFELKLSIPPAK